MDHRTKLQWARNHLDTLERSIKASLFDGDAYVVTTKYHAEHSGYVASFTEVRDTPVDWSLMIGDIVHNMRSALDTLTYSLACKNLRRPPDGEEVKQIQFPIVDDLELLSGELRRRIRHLHHDARAEICWVQPCLGVIPGQRHPLSVLRDLSNIDKHRHIVLAFAAVASSHIEFSGDYIDPGTRIQGYVGPVVKGAEIARYNFVFGTTIIPQHLHGKVDAKGHLTLEVKFAQGWPAFGGSVLGFLGHLIEFIRDDIIPPLETLLK